MGYSITGEQHDRMEANRREGRLCQGGVRSCTVRATRKVTVTSDAYNDGRYVHTSTITYCPRHARMYGGYVGYRGANFVVDAVEKF